MSHMLIINFLCTQDPKVRFVNSLNGAVSHLVVVGFDIVSMGGKDLNFNVGPQGLFTNKNASKEEKMLGKAPW